MLGILRTFKCGAISIDNPDFRNIGEFKIELCKSGILLMHLSNGGTCGVGEGVYACACDMAKNIYFTLVEDVSKGQDIVYRLAYGADVGTPYDKGIIDKNSNFIYKANGRLHIYNIDSCTDLQVDAAISSFKGILSDEEPPTNLARIPYYLELFFDVYPEKYLYRDIHKLHCLLDRLPEELISSTSDNAAAANLIVEILSMCGRANKDISPAIDKAFNEKYDGLRVLFG